MKRMEKIGKGKEGKESMDRLYMKKQGGIQ